MPVLAQVFMQNRKYKKSSPSALFKLFHSDSKSTQLIDDELRDKINKRMAEGIWVYRNASPHRMNEFERVCEEVVDYFLLLMKVIASLVLMNNHRHQESY